MLLEVYIDNHNEIASLVGDGSLLYGWTWNDYRFDTYGDWSQYTPDHYDKYLGNIPSELI